LQAGFRNIVGISSARAFAEAEDITDRVRAWQGWITTDPLKRWVHVVVWPRAPLALRSQT
jgi:hypothetical protein